MTDTDIEEKKDYLRGYERAVRQMERRELRIREIRLSKMCPSVRNDGLPRTRSRSDLSGYAARLDQEERKLMKNRYRRAMKCKEIMDRIEKLVNEDEKDVLTWRYIKLMKWEDICQKMCVSYKQAHRLHVRALENFEMK